MLNIFRADAVRFRLRPHVGKRASAGARGRDLPKLFAIYGALLGFNVLAWIWAFLAFASQPVLLGTTLIAYVFGLRHAVDADHIAAIDNIVRKLRSRPDGERLATLFDGLEFERVAAE